VVAGREIQRVLLVRLHNLLHLAPFRFGGIIVQTLNHIADADHEIRMLGIDFFPHLLEYACLRFAGAVAEDGESYRDGIRRGRR
jgi:hypothetical protein